MATISILFISLLLFIHPTSTTSGGHHRHHFPSEDDDAPPTPDEVFNRACNATRNKQLCLSVLAPYPRKNIMEIMHSAVTISYDNLRKAQPMVQSILTAAGGNPNRTTAAKNCIEHLNCSGHRLKMANETLPRREMKNIRTWTSAALTYHHDCWSALASVNDTTEINKTVSFLRALVDYTSIALNLISIYDVYGDASLWYRRTRTEREGFHGEGKGGGRLQIPGRLSYSDVTVCRNNTQKCTFTTVQAAVDVAPNWSPGWRFVIWVMAGVYKETVRVGIEKQHLVIFGDGMGKTVISGSLSVGHNTGLSTYNTATLAVLSEGFIASGLTIENTAGPGAQQAVAFRSDSDQSIIQECEFLGNQNTLYARTHRQFYNSCRIEGNVDFIFGNAAALFENCTILVRPRQQNPEKGEDNVVTAHGRIDPSQHTGFVFQKCSINGTKEYMKLYRSKPEVHKTFLGRPWKEFARTIFISCNFEALIAPQGWTPWKGDFGLKTLYFAEILNRGKGSELSRRVNWSSRVGGDQVNIYSVRSFLHSEIWKLTPS